MSEDKKAEAKKIADAKKAEAKKIADAKKAEAKKLGKVLFISKNGKSYEVKGNRFCFQGKKYTATEAVKNSDLMARLIEDQSPAIVKV